MQPGAAGKPVPDTEVEIVDLQNGAVLGAGETGEIRVRGPHLMRGYAGDPDETKLALRDGWLYTGDIGRIDTEGFVIISDRKKDVIFVKGFNVFPREVEETLLAHDAVSGACVVGRSDERAGELPVAFVTLRDTASEEHLLAHCADTLAGYKLPAEIVIRDALPMTPAAKVDRSALRAEANA
jgi:long-chain acyl-CoA synthetase